MTDHPLPQPDTPPSVSQTNESGHNFNVSGDNARVAGRDYYESPVIIKPSVMTCPPMPPRPPKFGGRDDELTTAAQSVKQKRRVAITALHGMGGLGKTTLAQELAHHLCENDAFQVVVCTIVGPDRDVRSVLEEWARRGDSNYSADYTRPPDVQTAKVHVRPYTTLILRRSDYVILSVFSFSDDYLLTSLRQLC